MMFKYELRFVAVHMTESLLVVVILCPAFVMLNPPKNYFKKL